MLLHDVKKGLQSSREIEITVTGRKSGREISFPVWFVLEGDSLFLLPLRGTATSWFPNLQANAAIGLSVRGKTATLLAKTITDENMLGNIVEKFRSKYGAPDVKKYYSRFDACIELH